MELLIIFGSIGILLIIIGVAMLVRIYFSSVVVDAECINISSSTVSIGAFPRTHYPVAARGRSGHRASPLLDARFRG